MSADSFRKPVFVTGASGYIGGRLVQRLLAAGYRVRCAAREPRKLESRPWVTSPDVEVVRCDVSDGATLSRSMAGCGSAYYLVHSMEAVGPAYRERDRALGETFASAAADAGLERIIYLGGLGETGPRLSEHLTSRREVERALASGPVPLTVLRAAMIIGSGSASFEILRYLVERLPVMFTPRWVRTESQPIAVRNVLHYLVACLGVPETVGRTLDIGGPEIVTYKELMQTMAAALGLRKRIIVTVPVLTPRLSSLWIHLVTPVSRRIARPLAEGLRNRVVCRDDAAERLMPQRLLTIREAIEAALSRTRDAEIKTAWFDAGPMPGDPDWAGGKLFRDERSVEVEAPPETVYAAVARIGGANGYYAADWLWQVRGWMDRLVGGPGLRRGRRDPRQLAFGEALDFWRVTAVEPNRQLELRAEMKLPGIAILRFGVQPNDRNPERATLTQTAVFQPKGLTGLAYWYSVMPLHGLVFEGMLKGIRQAAERAVRERRPNPPTVPRPYANPSQQTKST